LGYRPAVRAINQLEDPSIRAAGEDLYFASMIRERQGDPGAVFDAGRARQASELYVIERWASRLERWGLESCLRAASAVAARLLDRSGSPTLVEVTAVEQPELRGDLRAQLRAVLAGTGIGPSDGFVGRYGQSQAPLLLGAVLFEDDPSRAVAALKTAFEALVRTGVAGERDLRRAVRKRLAPWALGYGD
jgi:hypothetical protein